MPQHKTAGSWQPGQTGNPNGRPPKVKCLTDLLRKKLAAKGPDGKPNIEAITKKVMELALNGERWAVELIWDRIEGKPAQALQLTGADGQRLAFTLDLGEKDDDSS